MKNYYRVMLGKNSAYASDGFDGNYIGGDFEINQDLTNKLPEEVREFNREFVPIYRKACPNKSKLSAARACGFLHTIVKKIKEQDIVLCPDGEGRYRVGEVVSGYSFHAGEKLPHRRAVNWYTKTIERLDMSTALKNSTGSIGTVCSITKHSNELEKLIGSQQSPTLIATDEMVEDPRVFALEKHLEEFLVANWQQTELGIGYDIFEDDGELVGQQYPSDTGPIDILAISKDKKELLVVELKKGRASDTVVGQIQRYMGYVLEELAEDGQVVKGVIIALEDDLKLRRSLAVTQNITFYRYQVSFKLFKG